MKYEELVRGRRVETMFQIEGTAYAKLGSKKGHSTGLTALEEWRWLWGGQGGVNRGRRLGSRGRQDQVMTCLWSHWDHEDEGHVRDACDLPWCGGGLE